MYDAREAWWTKVQMREHRFGQRFNITLDRATFRRGLNPNFALILLDRYHFVVIFVLVHTIMKNETHDCCHDDMCSFKLIVVLEFCETL